MAEELNAMEVLARAALYIPELARGIEGEVEIEVDEWLNPSNQQEILAEIREAQITLYLAGWRQDKAKARLAPRSHNFECAVYKKQFRPGRLNHYITVEITTRFGLWSRWRGVGTKLEWL